jgi:uncharacterized protein
LTKTALAAIVSFTAFSRAIRSFLLRSSAGGAAKQDSAPVSSATFVKSVIAYTFFILGCLFLSIAGLLLLRINPFYRKKALKIFNSLISITAWAQIYVMVSVTKRVVFDEKPDFTKPCIFVANHQSVLDILSMIMLSPRIILLTNRWVWNSPLFGSVVRFAGYYPIFEGADPGIDKLKSKIDDGYSIAIFPEGTRSKDGKIGRFHKGAFYLAQKLELDIIPVLFHDTRRCIAKGSFVVRDSTFTVRVMPRILFTGTEYGATYQEKTKTINELFRKQYEIMDEETRTPANYGQRLPGSFSFTSPFTELQMKITLRREKNFEVFHRLAPPSGVILDAGCGNGILSYMLAYLSPQRQVTGFDQDDQNINTAESGFDKPANLHFVRQKQMEFQLPLSNCVIFRDMLHSLKEPDRTRVFTEYSSQVLPGGIIIVRDYKNKPRVFSPGSIISLGESLGFSSEIIDQEKQTKHLIIVFKREGHG